MNNKECEEFLGQLIAPPAVDALKRFAEKNERRLVDVVRDELYNVAVTLLYIEHSDELSKIVGVQREDVAATEKERAMESIKRHPAGKLLGSETTPEEESQVRAAWRDESPEAWDKASEAVRHVSPVHPERHTTDHNDPRLGRGVDQEKTPMHEAYLVLSEEERAKGFVRPVRQEYVHVRGKACGVKTWMNRTIAETYARNPKFYGATFCVGCQMHLAVDEFDWDGTDQAVGS